MTRPKSLRQIEALPGNTWFKPAGVSMRNLEEVSLTLDEFEALRLADLEGLYHANVAERMDVSRQTIGRILSVAHKKIAEALVHGKAIRLEGGKVKLGQTEKESKKEGKGRHEGFRVAIPSTGPSLDAAMDPRLGNCPYLIIFNTEDSSIEVLDNKQNMDPDKSNGGNTAQHIIDCKVDAVITCDIGKNISSILAGDNIEIYVIEGGTGHQAITLFKKEKGIKE